MNEKVLLFYKPTGHYGCFSNWYESSFIYRGVHYTSSEQYMMHQKALLFQDDEIAQKILLETNLLQIKKLGRLVKYYDDKRWGNARLQIMRRGLRAKFMQNKDILEILLSTNDDILAEAAPRDVIWGIGLGSSNPKSKDPNQWRGRNLLGKVLMKVRRDLRKIVENSTISQTTIIIDKTHPIMNKTLQELLENKKTKQTIKCYLYSLPHYYQEKDHQQQLLNLTINQIEDEIKNPNNIYKPTVGFYEMQYDLQEMITYKLID